MGETVCDNEQDTRRAKGSKKIWLFLSGQALSFPGGSFRPMTRKKGIASEPSYLGGAKHNQAPPIMVSFGTSQHCLEHYFSSIPPAMSTRRKSHNCQRTPIANCGSRRTRKRSKRNRLLLVLNYQDYASANDASTSIPIEWWPVVFLDLAPVHRHRTNCWTKSSPNPTFA